MSCAGARSLHPHGWREAHQQLPAVATRLHRTLLHRRCFGPTSTTVRCHRLLSGRERLRPHQRAAQGRRRGMGPCSGSRPQQSPCWSACWRCSSAGIGLARALSSLVRCGGVGWGALARFERIGCASLAVALPPSRAFPGLERRAGPQRRLGGAAAVVAALCLQRVVLDLRRTDGCAAKWSLVQPDAGLRWSVSSCSCRPRWR